MSFQHLTIERPEHNIARVTLRRPEVRNAFNARLIADLTLAFDEIARSPDVRAVVLAAEGAAFCAGADLNWMRSMAGFTWDENFADGQALAHMLHTLYTCPVPVVGRVQGDCYGGGVGLAAVCDVVVAAEGVQFCLSEAKLGLVPATISPYVIRALGAQAARRYFVTAERFSAQRAQALGWVAEVCSAEQLDAQVEAIAKAIVANGPVATRRCKRLVQEMMEQDLKPAVLDQTARLIADMRCSPEGQEGMQSFLQRRLPAWLGAKPEA